MIVRYIPADPAGNLTAIVLSPVAPQARAAVAARMMARCPEGFEQVGFAEEDSLTGEFPRLCMMGGEFCGNAARAFACYAAGVRGRGETRRETLFRWRSSLRAAALTRRCPCPARWTGSVRTGGIFRWCAWRASTTRCC